MTNLTNQYDDVKTYPEDIEEKPHGNSGLSTSNSSRTGSGRPQISQGLGSERVQENEQGTSPRVLSDQGEGSGGLRSPVDRNGDVRGSSLDTGSKDSHSGTGQRLSPSTIPVPKDIVLSSSEIESISTAGAAYRFDTNLEAIRTLKTIKAPTM